MFGAIGATVGRQAAELTKKVESEIQDLVYAVTGQPILQGTTEFKNWSGNIETDLVVEFPGNDAEISQHILQAKSSGRKVSVVGTRHSASPAVCDNSENNMLLINLAQYSMAHDAVPDFQVDAKSASPTLTVNAGWNLDKVMRKLGKHWPQYIFEAQTAGRIFSMGGLVNMCTHGGCMRGGLIADTVVKVRFIDANGEVTVVSDEDELRFHRMSFGAFGVLTHVTMRLREITELEVDIRKGENIEMTETFFYNYFKDKASWDAPLFQQFFFNFHNMTACYCAWKETGTKRTAKKYPKHLHSQGGGHQLGGAPVVPFLDETLDATDLNYRKSKNIVEKMTHLSCEIPAKAWKLNADGENDAFWVNSLPAMPASHWTAFMIPVDLPDLSKIFKAIKIAYDKFQAIEKAMDAGKAMFRPDVALEGRFIWSSNSYFAPAFSEERYSQLYFVIEYATLNSNLALNKEQAVRHDDHEGPMLQLGRECREFFADLEKSWMEIDPRVKPHLAKVCCFGPRADDPTWIEPFNPMQLAKVLSADRKSKISEKLHKADPTMMFRNKMVTALLQSA